MLSIGLEIFMLTQRYAEMELAHCVFGDFNATSTSRLNGVTRATSDLDEM